MKLRTFYKIYYEHRLKKTSLILKVYILIVLPFNYLLNKLFLQSIKNLDVYSKKNQSLFDKDLNFLFKYFNSDKGDSYINQYEKPINKKKEIIEGHNYHKFYEKYFSTKKNNSLEILEIGSFKGNAAASFFFYFPKALIFSADIFPDLFRYRSKRIKNFFMDNSKTLELQNKIINQNFRYDIIIEDAGHYFKDQIITLFILFKSLKPKGIFVIEELEFPNNRLDMNTKGEKPTLKDILRLIKDKKDFYSKYITDEQKEYFLKNYDKIDLLHGSTSEIAFITKK